MGYVKLWDNVLDNIKVQRLSPEVFKSWVNLLAVTVRYGGPSGELPSWDDMQFGLRSDRATIEGWIKALVTAGLVDRNGSRYSLHDFEKWNESKDKTAAKRQKEWRERNALRNALRNGVTEASHNTPQELEGNEGLEEEKKTPLPPTGDEVVDFGRAALGDRFDLESVGQNLAGWRAAGYADAWIKDAILVANASAKHGLTAYIATCLRRWTKRGSPDPEEIAKARAVPIPDYVPPVTDHASIYGPKWKPSENGIRP